VSFASEARLLRDLVKILRAPGYDTWTARDVADWLEIEIERREHPEKFRPEYRPSAHDSPAEDGGAARSSS